MLKLGGREFDVISSGTIEWDVTLLNLLSGCGLAEVTLHAGEDAEGLAQRVYRTLMSSGAVFEILGCVLIEHGLNQLDWNPDIMADTAAYIRKLHAPADKAAITSQITSLVAGFFQQGLLSVRTFPSYSTHLNGAATEQRPVSSEESSTAGSASGA